MVALLKFWYRWKEVSTIIGFLVLLGSVLCGLWLGFCFIEQANANTAEIAKLNDFRNDATMKIQHIDDTLDDLISWYGIPRRKSAHNP